MAREGKLSTNTFCCEVIYVFVEMFSLKVSLTTLKSTFSTHHSSFNSISYPSFKVYLHTSLNAFIEEVSCKLTSLASRAEWSFKYSKFKLRSCAGNFKLNLQQFCLQKGIIVLVNSGIPRDKLLSLMM